MGMGMPGLGSALGMGMALGAGSAVGHAAMNSLFGGGGRGGEMGYGGYDPSMSGAAPPQMMGGGGAYAPGAEGMSLVDYANREDLQMTPEQLNQKQLEQQAATDPCFNTTSMLLNCLKDNPKNIGLCQMQMDEMVSCQRTHQPS